jgi:parallel beta helix pectate lyase-like protein
VVGYGFDSHVDIESVTFENWKTGYRFESACVFVASSTADPLSRKLAGFVCDGVNDHVQIQAAIDSLPSDGGLVLLSEGTFYIGDTIEMPTTKRMTLSGKGPVSTEIKLADGANADMIYAQESQQVVCDLSLNGNKDNNSSGGYGIKITDTKVWINRVWISSCKLTGIYTVGASAQAAAHANRFTDIFITLCDQDGMEFGQYSYDATVSNVWIGDCGRDGIRGNTSTVLLVNVHSWGNTGNGLFINSGSGGGWQVSNSYFETNDGRGVRIGSTSPSCQFTGCHFKSNGSQGLYDFSGHKLTITGCVFKNNINAGIRVDTVTEATIVGNTFYDDQAQKTQDRPIDDAGGADYIIFVGNNARAANHQTGGASLAGANNVVANNLT